MNDIEAFGAHLRELSDAHGIELAQEDVQAIWSESHARGFSPASTEEIFSEMVGAGEPAHADPEPGWDDDDDEGDVEEEGWAVRARETREPQGRGPRAA